MKKNNGKKLVTVCTREASLKRRLRRHLKSLGFHRDDDGTLIPPGTDKDICHVAHHDAVRGPWF
jgi:hypothetical protein